jgi:plasmid maintenance system antidote protein VapI
MPLTDHAAIPTAGDLRAALARAGVPLYRVAAVVGLHPSRRSGYMNGRMPVTADIAARLLAAIEAEQRESA